MASQCDPLQLSSELEEPIHVYIQDENAVEIAGEMTGEIVAEFDVINESPAILPDNLERNKHQWLARQDELEDHIVRGLMTGDQLDFDWSNDPKIFISKPEDFRGQSGPTFPIDKTTKPLDIFLKFFDDEVFDVLVTQINQHISSIARPLQKGSRFDKIENTCKEELAIFFAILILQGLIPLPLQQDYFVENGFLTLKYFKHIMKYNRFIVLKRLLYFTNDEGPTDNLTVDEHKLKNLEPLLNILSKKYSELYRPSKEIAIDDSLLQWHGRMNFAQKIVTKASKEGVKSYELCECKSGYLWKFFTYTGNGQTHGQTYDDDVGAPKKATAQIVMDLVKPLLNLGHTLTVDNFHTSPLLARYLKAHGTDCLGTLRVAREFVPEAIKSVTKRELRQGELVQTYCRDLSISVWNDKNIISMISTCHGEEVGAKEKYGSHRFKPPVALDYNIAMGGVAKKGQVLSAQPIERTRNAWYTKVFTRLINVTVCNAYIIYKTQNPKICQREFRVTLANELIKAFHRSTIESLLTSGPEVNVLKVIRGKKRDRPILSGNHFVGQGRTRFHLCVWCRKSRTYYICKQCDAALCLKTCFEEYHTSTTEENETG